MIANAHLNRPHFCLATSNEEKSNESILSGMVDLDRFGFVDHFARHVRLHFEQTQHPNLSSFSSRRDYFFASMSLQMSQQEDFTQCQKIGLILRRSPVCGSHTSILFNRILSHTQTTSGARTVWWIAWRFSCTYPRISTLLVLLHDSIVLNHFEAKTVSKHSWRVEIWCDKKEEANCFSFSSF